MKKWQKLVIRTAAKRILNNLERGPETTINLFNSGFIISSKQITRKALETLLEVTGKQRVNQRKKQ